MSILYVRLDQKLEQALVKAAQQELRTPAAQAAFILRSALLGRPSEPDVEEEKRKEGGHAA